MLNFALFLTPSLLLGLRLLFSPLCLGVAHGGILADVNNEGNQPQHQQHQDQLDRQARGLFHSNLRPHYYIVPVLLIIQVAPVFPILPTLACLLALRVGLPDLKFGIFSNFGAVLTLD